MSKNHPDTPATSTWPSPERAAELFARLVAGDRLATADLAAAYLEPLVAYLQWKHPRVDDDVRLSAAVDAVASLFKKPERYKPDRGELAAYLKMSADGDLKNLLASEAKHHTNRQSLDFVEVEAAARNSGAEAEDSGLPSFDHPALADAIRGFTDAERCALDLMRAGERDTAKFAAVLGLADLTTPEQAAEVKRVKDRIKQRLRRAIGGKHG